MSDGTMTQAELKARAIGMEVVNERLRQIDNEGYDWSHDDAHKDGSLARAAAHYAAPDTIYTLDGYGDLHESWPWGKEYDKKGKHDRRRQCVIAMALLMAEVERIDRA